MVARSAALPARYFSFVLSYADESGLPSRPLMRAAALVVRRLLAGFERQESLHRDAPDTVGLPAPHQYLPDVSRRRRVG